MNSRSKRWFNDAASELSARNAYQSKAEAECKKSNRVAWDFRGAGKAGAPYRNCVSGKMSDYDASVGAEQAAKKQAEEDKRQLEIETKKTQNVQVESDSTARVLSAQAQVASVQAQADTDTAKASNTKMIIIVGGSLAALILVGVIVMAVKGSGSTATK
jgi:hypothetical protein